MTNTEQFKNDEMVKMDRMLYTKNTSSSNYILLAILADVFYFVSLYKMDVGSYFYTWKIGVSIIYNLIFMLIGFLSYEEVKNRGQDKKAYIALIVLGVIQILRIFFIPLQAYHATVNINSQDVQVLSTGKFIWMAGCLLVSAVCLFLASLTAQKQNKALAAYVASKAEGKA